MTADATCADIVLPATTNYENLGYERYPGGYCQLRQRVIDPIGEAKSGYTFLRHSLVETSSSKRNNLKHRITLP